MVYTIETRPDVMTITVPTLNDMEDDFQRLFMIYSSAMSSNASSIVFTFTHCSFLRPNAVAFLGGVSIPAKRTIHF